jgi:nuclear mRNA export protein PCID2/THP1
MDAYLTQVGSALHGKNITMIAELMALPCSNNRQFSNEDKQLISTIKHDKNLGRTVYNNLRVDQAISEVVTLRLQSLVSLYDKDYEEAYRFVHGAHNGLFSFMESNIDFPFLAKLLAKLAENLRIIASLADDSKLEREKLSSTCLRECQNSITRSFTLVAKDRLPITDPYNKKSNIFSITNTLFKIYFKLNTLQLMGKIIKLIDTPSIMNNIKLFPLCDVVTYKFYLGRLALFEDRLEDARESFQFALKYTPYKSSDNSSSSSSGSHGRDQLHNRQLILASLVPIEMSFGIMPTDIISNTYGLHELVEIGNAIKCGNLKTFNEIFNKNKVIFIRNGTYLVIEQLKNLIYRNLFKKISIIINCTRLNIFTFHNILKKLQSDNASPFAGTGTTSSGADEMDIDEIECILANLIYQNKIKGYISHQKRILVIGKNDPFPADKVVTKRVRVEG